MKRFGRISFFHPQIYNLFFHQVWPGVSRLDLFEKLEIPRGSKRRVKERLKPYVKDQYACDLIDKLLSLDPSKRYYDFYCCKKDSSGSSVFHSP